MGGGCKFEIPKSLSTYIYIQCIYPPTPEGVWEQKKEKEKKVWTHVFGDQIDVFKGDLQKKGFFLIFLNEIEYYFSVYKK